MKIKLLPHNFKNFLLTSILAVSFLCSSLQNSFAITDKLRYPVTISNEGRCVTDPLGFDPTGTKPDGAEWELDNPTCMGLMVGTGVALFSADTVSAVACNLGARVALMSASKAAGVVLSPANAASVVANATACATMSATGNPVQAALCCSTAAAYGVIAASAVTSVAVIYGYAVGSQRDAHICGETWNTWERRPAAQASPADTEGIPDYQNGDLDGNNFYIYGAQDYSYQKELRDEYKSGAMTLAISNKRYREFIYGGFEVEDSGDGACKNPTGWNSATKNRILGFDTEYQRYYMRGPASASNYACGRFLLNQGTAEEKRSSKDAYECCKKRSQETICIEEGEGLHLTIQKPFQEFCKVGERCEVGDVLGVNLATKKPFQKFCKVGERCKVRDVWYDIHQAKTVPNHICATTYSVCPYNHNMGGGTEIADYDKKYHTIQNHCQYLKHCAKIPDVPYIRTSDLDGGWISSACFDLKGDSQNEYEYDGPLTPFNKTKHFSAPMAQCFKETLENMFVNKAGNTKCNNPDESPNQQGDCISGYRYKVGEVILGQASFFQTLQDKFRTAIKLVMTMAVTIAGITVLISNSPWDKKTIIMFIIKLGLVSYFALGTAWQDTFFRAVSSASTDLADIFMKIDQGVAEEDKDGCQFPRFNYDFAEGVTQGSKYDIQAYPPGKEYLKIWDTLDCKIVRALGFGPEVSVPNLIIMIVAGFLSSGFGLFFFVATFIFAFYLIALTVRALHIFLISSMAITIMIYVSPITITAVLFNKTSSIFRSWRTNLLSFVLQPVILFAYLGILITLFDHTMIGDAKFSGDGKVGPKGIICSDTLTVGDHIANNVINPLIDRALNPAIEAAGIDGSVGNVATKSVTAAGNVGDNSIYCIFQFADIKTNNALSPIGIALPVLLNMNQAKISTIIKGALLMFIFTQFLDKISSFAATLLGGVALGESAQSTLGGLKKFSGVASAVTSRGTNATRKWGGKAAGSVKGFIGQKNIKGEEIRKDGKDKSAPPNPPKN